MPRATTYRILWLLFSMFAAYISFESVNSLEFSPLVKILTFLVVFGFQLITLFCVFALLMLIVLLIAYVLNPKDRSKEIKLTSTLDGIKAETSSTRSEIKWSGIRKIKKTKSHIFIFLSDVAAFAVPYRAFSEPWEGKQFYNSIIELWNSNKNI